MKQVAGERYDRTRDDYESVVIPSPEEMAEKYARVEIAVRKMKSRGCRVIFVRLPSSGRVWALDRQVFPRRLYWDRFSTQTMAETIHFSDYLSLSEFECPDGSHLDYADALLFTRAFAEVLIENDAAEKAQGTREL